MTTRRAFCLLHSSSSRGRSLVQDESCFQREEPQLRGSGLCGEANCSRCSAPGQATFSPACTHLKGLSLKTSASQTGASCSDSRSHVCLSSLKRKKNPFVMTDSARETSN